MMGSRCTLAGVEVPIIGSDSVKWTELSLPPSSTSIAISDSDTNVSVPSICSPLSDDFASCSAIGDPPIYVTWSLSVPNFLNFFFVEIFCIIIAQIVELSCVIRYRRIQKSLPNALELLELCADKEFPRIGLRITFPDALSASAFVCKNEVLLKFFPLLCIFFILKN